MTGIGAAERVRWATERGMLVVEIAPILIEEWAKAVGATVVIPEPDEDGFTTPIFTKETTP